MKYLTFLTSSWAQSRLTVAEVNDYLDNLADSNLKKDRPGRGEESSSDAAEERQCTGAEVAHQDHS